MEFTPLAMSLVKLPRVALYLKSTLGVLSGEHRMRLAFLKSALTVYCEHTARLCVSLPSLQKGALQIEFGR